MRTSRRNARYSVLLKERWNLIQSVISHGDIEVGKSHINVKKRLMVSTKNSVCTF